MACDSNIRRIVFGPEGQVLDVGRTQRTVPPHIRTAVIARDKHCVYPNCAEPPQRSEVHHAITHWAEGGETSVENACLLYWHHHAYVDGQGITMRFHTPSGTWRFFTRQGTPTGFLTGEPNGSDFRPAS
ncbi:MAG: HNH endonuclease [Promicromonosporaceae bacterium]|nr:HNH endonuclease [Promicromonosporaceae bacterium]